MTRSKKESNETFWDELCQPNNPFKVLHEKKAVATTEVVGQSGTFVIDTGPGTSIDISFEPSPDIDCDKILFIQTVRVLSDGNSMIPSDYTPDWNYRDPDSTLNGWFVDHLFCEQDPFYNGDDIPQDSGDQGSSSPPHDSNMHDAPNGNVPPGAVSLDYEFETCAVCAEGADAGVNYGCIKWHMTRPAGGAATVTVDSTDVEDPSEDFTDALDQFESNHLVNEGTRMCPDGL